MKTNRLSAAFLAALVLFVLSACGGGGGDSSPAPTVPVVVVTPTPVTPTPVVVTVTCPNGATVATAVDCPAVGTGPIALQGSVMSPTTLDQGVTLQFNGALNPSSVVVSMKQGNFVLGSSSTLGGGDKDLTFKSTMRAGYGQAVTVVITATDTLGRTVSVTISFTMSAMVCSSNAIWSNPATFSTVYQDCVAPIGVQALVTPSLNTMTDTSCVPTVGVPLSASCRAYMANGTMLLADTSVIVQNNPTVWMAYIGMDTKSNMVLLDTTTMAPIGTMVSPNSLVWEIGNTTGVNVDVIISGLLRNEQITWGGAALAVTCHTNCPI